MANMLLNEIWRLRIASYTPSQAAINVVHYKVTSLLGAVTDNYMIDQFNTLVGPLYAAILSDDARYRGVSLQRAFPAPPTRAIADVDGDTAGVVAGEILPGQIAGIVSVGTAFAGKSQRGRIYLPFPSETDNELPGLPTDTYVAAAQALANAIFVPISKAPTPGVNEITLTPVVFHRANSTSDAITTKLAKKLWATQRRRGSYGRQNLPPF